MTTTQGILGAVILLVLVYFARCWHLIGSARPRTRLQILRDRLTPGIDDSVASGRDLDWVYYTEEGQRKHEDLREHLRNYGTISLATGVGGTMAALALHLLSADATQGDALDLLLEEMGLALIASGTGVLGNLAILWGLLPWANRRFNPELDRFLDGLRDHETKERAKAPALQQNTAEIIGDRLGDELRSVISRVPELFESLGETARVLGSAADKLDGDVTVLASATSALAESTSSLKTMPEALNEVLGKALGGLSAKVDELRVDMREWTAERRTAAAETEKWRVGLQSAVESAGKQQREAADRLEATARAVAESVDGASASLAEIAGTVSESVRDLPGRVASAVEGSGDELGRKVGDGVAPHLKTFQSELNTVLGRALDGVARQTDSFSNDVRALMSEWQTAAGRSQAILQGAVAEAGEQHREAAVRLDAMACAVADSVDGASASLAETAATVGESVRDMPDRVASAVEGSGDELGRKLGDGLAPHLTTFQSELDTVLGRALEGIAGQIDSFWSHMRTLATEWQGAAGESHAILRGAISEAGEQHRKAANELDAMARAVTESVDGASAILAENADTVRESVRDLPGRVAAAVAGSGDELGRSVGGAIEPHVTGFRDAVADGLDKTLEWQTAVNEQLTEAREQHQEGMRNLVSTTEDVVENVRSLPDKVKRSVQQVSGTLGREFGHAALQHVEGLRRSLMDHAETLHEGLKDHESSLLNTTVQDLQEVSSELIRKTVHELATMSDQLRAVLDGFPKHVLAVSTGLGDAKEHLTDAVTRIEGVAPTIGSAHQQTVVMLAALVRSTQRLERGIGDISAAHAEAIAKLADALRKPSRKRWWRRVPRFLRRSSPDGSGERQEEGAA